MAMRIETVLVLCCLTIAGCSRTYPDGTYKGDTRRGLRHGQGTMRFKNGDVFTGAWADDRMNGSGTMRYADGGVYAGQWVASQKSGRGTMRYANGETYEGAWVNGMRHGRGMLRYPDGDTYSGEWEANQKKACGDLGDQVATLPTLPEVVYEGTVETSVNPKTSKVRLTIPGKVSLRAVDNKCLAFCMKTVKIHANGRVPLSVFSVDLTESRLPDIGMPYHLTTITINGVSLELSKAGMGPMILAGKDGAVLEKVGAGFRLTKGRAYVCQAAP